MVIGLLTLAGIPTTIGVAQGISRRDEANKAEKEQTEQQMRKFRLECYCEEDTSSIATSLSGGRVILREGRMYIEPPAARHDSARRDDVGSGGGGGDGGGVGGLR